VALAERTDHLEAHADALLALAEVLRRAGRAAEATADLRHALAMARQKGNPILARSAEEALGTPP
jgi:predicted RNA polymerase sigma factor